MSNFTAPTFSPDLFAGHPALSFDETDDEVIELLREKIRQEPRLAADRAELLAAVDYGRDGSLWLPEDQLAAEIDKLNELEERVMTMLKQAEIPVTSRTIGYGCSVFVLLGWATIDAVANSPQGFATGPVEGQCSTELNMTKFKLAMNDFVGFANWSPGVWDKSLTEKDPIGHLSTSLKDAHDQLNFERFKLLSKQATPLLVGGQSQQLKLKSILSRVKAKTYSITITLGATLEGLNAIGKWQKRHYQVEVTVRFVQLKPGAPFSAVFEFYHPSATESPRVDLGQGLAQDVLLHFVRAFCADLADFTGAEHDVYVRAKGGVLVVPPTKGEKRLHLNELERNRCANLSEEDWRAKCDESLAFMEQFKGLVKCLQHGSILQEREWLAKHVKNHGCTSFVKMESDGTMAIVKITGKGWKDSERTVTPTDEYTAQDLVKRKGGRVRLG